MREAIRAAFIAAMKADPTLPTQLERTTRLTRATITRFLAGGASRRTTLATISAFLSRDPNITADPLILYVDESFIPKQAGMLIGITTTPTHIDSFGSFERALYPQGWHHGTEVKSTTLSVERLRQIMIRSYHHALGRYLFYTTMPRPAHTTAFSRALPYLFSITTVIMATRVTQITVHLDEGALTPPQLAPLSQLLTRVTGRTVTLDMLHSQRSLGIQYCDLMCGWAQKDSWTLLRAVGVVTKPLSVLLMASESAVPLTVLFTTKESTQLLPPKIERVWLLRINRLAAALVAVQSTNGPVNQALLALARRFQSALAPKTRKQVSPIPLRSLLTALSWSSFLLSLAPRLFPAKLGENRQQILLEISVGLPQLEEQAMRQFPTLVPLLISPGK